MDENIILLSNVILSNVNFAYLNFCLKNSQDILVQTLLKRVNNFTDNKMQVVQDKILTLMFSRDAAR